MSFFNTCAKWFLFATNFLIFVLSCVGVGLGIWVFCDRSSFLNLLDQVNWRDDATAHIYSSGAILILVTAIAAIFLSFFGCCGASKESRCMLGTVSLGLRPVKNPSSVIPVLNSKNNDNSIIPNTE